MSQKSKLPIVRFYWDHKRVRFDTLSIFTKENDHNPFVAKKCPKCDGEGAICENYVQADGRVCFEACNRCKGTGHIDKPIRLFENEREPIIVYPKSDGWLKCPFCGWIFTINDKAVWTGCRHRCGQKLTIEFSSEIAAE